MTQVSPITTGTTAAILWFAGKNRTHYITFKNEDGTNTVDILSSFTDSFNAVSSTNHDASLSPGGAITFQIPNQPLAQIQSTWFAKARGGTPAVSVSEG